jgi:hypothetical protein
MNGSFHKRVCVLLTLMVFAASPIQLPAADEDQVDLAEITERLIAWRSSFISVRMVYETRRLSPDTTEPLTDWPAPTDPEEGHLWGRHEWIWSDDGMDLWAEIPLKANGQRGMDVFNSREGVSFRASYKWENHGPERLQQLEVQGAGVGKPITRKVRTPVCGLYWNSSARWLPEVLTEGNWTLEGFDEISGVRCARISPPPGLRSGHVLTWIDLSHDCLVRREVSFSSKDPDRIDDDFIVDEFQRMPNGIWLPKRGRLQLNDGANHHWLVTEAAFNQPLDLRRFQVPEPIEGTLVIEGANAPYRHGSRRASSAPQHANGETGNANQTPTRSATPPGSGWKWWSGGLAIFSFIFLAAGLWIRRKRMENSS